MTSAGPHGHKRDNPSRSVLVWLHWISAIKEPPPGDLAQTAIVRILDVLIEAIRMSTKPELDGPFHYALWSVFPPGCFVGGGVHHSFPSRNPPLYSGVSLYLASMAFWRFHRGITCSSCVNAS